MASIHDTLMRKALHLAEKYRGQTSPNPMVGALVVKNGCIVGSGAHQASGTPHAEIHALNAAGKNALGADLYVTLEPCCHYGKTPPCTKAIINAGIKRIFVAMEDPNPLVRGKGCAELQQNNISVISGVQKNRAEKLNEVFCTYITKHRPFVTLKAALSLDGNIALQNGESKWITNEKSRLKVQKIRSISDAILVGKNTFLIDNPRLTVRIPQEKSLAPLRIILCTNLPSPQQIIDSKLYKQDHKERILFIGKKNSKNKEISRQLERVHIKTFLLNTRVATESINELMLWLGTQSVSSLLVEGGSKIYTSFIQSKMVDKYHLFYAPFFMGSNAKRFLEYPLLSHLNSAENLQIDTANTLDNNIEIIAYPPKENACSPV